MPRAVRATPLLVLDSRGENGGGWVRLRDAARGREGEGGTTVWDPRVSYRDSTTRAGGGGGPQVHRITRDGSKTNARPTGDASVSSVMVFLSAHAAAPHLNFLKQRRFGD